MVEIGQPEKKFKAGSCTASVFVNEIEGREGKTRIKSVTLQRTYLDKDGKFHNTASFKEQDLPKAILVLNKAYEYLALEKAVEQTARH